MRDHLLVAIGTAAAALPLLISCSSDVVESSTASNGAGAGQTTTAQGGSGGGGAAGQGGAGAGAGGQGGGPGGGTVCGGFSGATCPDTHFCDYPLDSCGAADETGICTTRPENCDTSLDPICACDGMIYSNTCNAHGAGRDVSLRGGCTIDPGMFACGPRICNAASEYCENVGSSGPNLPDEFSCEPLPSPCNMMSVANCTCMQPTADDCGGGCTQDGTTGGITINCPGG